MTPTTQLRRSEHFRIDDADPMLLADGFTVYERTVRFEELNNGGAVIRTSVHAVYTRLQKDGVTVTFFRPPFSGSTVWNS